MSEERGGVVRQQEGDKNTGKGGRKRERSTEVKLVRATRKRTRREGRHVGGERGG